VDTIQTPQALDEFIANNYAKIRPKLVHNKDFIVRNWEKWFAPHGPKVLQYHTEPLDFKLVYEAGKGAVLYQRSLCGGSLKWRGDTFDQGIVILSQVPLGEPEIVPRKLLTSDQTESFLEAMNGYISKEAIVHWRAYFQDAQKPVCPKIPFALTSSKNPKEKPVHFPQSVVPEEFVDLYAEYKTKPWKLYVEYYERQRSESPPRSESPARTESPSDAFDLKVSDNSTSETEDYPVRPSSNATRKKRTRELNQEAASFKPRAKKVNAKKVVKPTRLKNKSKRVNGYDDESISYEDDEWQWGKSETAKKKRGF
jgi:hypothetical protein